jgi:hypothetical protein
MYGSPVTIDIEITKSVSSEHMESCQLSTFQNLTCVILRFDHFHDESEVYGAIDWLKKRSLDGDAASIQELRVKGCEKGVHVGKISDKSLLPDLIAALSPSTVSIDWVEFDFDSHSSQDPKCSSVRDLKLSHIMTDRNDFHALLRLFTSVKTLTIDRVSTWTTSSTPASSLAAIEFDQLSSLIVRDTEFPWGLTLHCPNLEKVRFKDGLYPDVGSFLRTNSSMTTMEWPANTSVINFSAIAQAAKQVTHLILYTWSSFELLSVEVDGGLPFPFLHCITLLKGDQKTSSTLPSSSSSDPEDRLLERRISELIKVRYLGMREREGVESKEIKGGERVRRLRLGEGLEPFEFCEELKGVPWSVIPTDHDQCHVREYSFQ